MKIRMLVDTLVAADGFTVETWAKGEIRSASDQLGGDLIAAGKAERAKSRGIAINDEGDTQ